MLQNLLEILDFSGKIHCRIAATIHIQVMQQYFARQEDRKAAIKVILLSDGA